jgi:hypothetical protein
MAGFSTASDEHLIRSEVWSTQLKKILEDSLMGMRYVRMLDFPDGQQFTIPSIGQMPSRNYVEGSQILYDAMDTGEFTFTITEYKSAATYITNKMKQDSFYMSELVSSFVPSMSRALAVAMEADILKTPTPQGTGGQTSASTNAINTAAHRWIGSGTNETISIVDFAKARFALQKANVPLTNLIAIVDPSVEFALNTLTNLVNVSNNPRWEGIIKTGIGGGDTGMRFITNIYGFDVYTSNYLTTNTASETISGLTASAGVNNLFFSAASDVLPIVGSVRQTPKVDSSYNKDFQREEYVTTCRYGLKTYRPENVVIVVTDTDQV